MKLIFSPWFSQGFRKNGQRAGIRCALQRQAGGWRLALAPTSQKTPLRLASLQYLWGCSRERAIPVRASSPRWALKVLTSLNACTGRAQDEREKLMSVGWQRQRGPLESWYFRGTSLRCRKHKIPTRCLRLRLERLLDSAFRALPFRRPFAVVTHWSSRLYRLSSS